MHTFLHDRCMRAVLPLTYLCKGVATLIAYYQLTNITIEVKCFVCMMATGRWFEAGVNLVRKLTQFLKY